MAEKQHIKHLRSAVSGKVPSADILEYGELAVNYADEVIYLKNTNNEVVALKGGGESYVAQDGEPTDTSVLWIDTDDGTEDSESIIAVDAYMSDTSTNPVQNMVVKEYIDNMFQVVTEAEYSALGDTVNTDGVIYLITE